MKSATEAARSLDTLKEGNARFSLDRPRPRDHAHARVLTVQGQSPIAAVLACSDSRVPVETVFDAGIGELFVVRTAGGVVDDASFASLRFAVESLNAPVIVVMGHEQCGAVTASLAAEQPEWLAPVTSRVRAHAEAGDDVLAAVEHHVLETARELDASLGSRAVVAAAVYELGSGRVRWLPLREG